MVKQVEVFLCLVGWVQCGSLCFCVIWMVDLVCFVFDGFLVCCFELCKYLFLWCWFLMYGEYCVYFQVCVIDCLCYFGYQFGLVQCVGFWVEYQGVVCVQQFGCGEIDYVLVVCVGVVQWVQFDLLCVGVDYGVVGDGMLLGCDWLVLEIVWVDLVGCIYQVLQQGQVEVECVDWQVLGYCFVYVCGMWL